jgi:N-formylglutamate amidohydrolase
MNFLGSDKYYSGGYITQKHGSSCGGSVDAIQLETPKEVRVDGGEEKRERFAKALGRAIATFYRIHYTN